MMTLKITSGALIAIGLAMVLVPERLSPRAAYVRGTGTSVTLMGVASFLVLRSAESRSYVAAGVMLCIGMVVTIRAVLAYRKQHAKHESS